MPVFQKPRFLRPIAYKAGVRGRASRGQRIRRGASGADEREPLGLLAFDRSVAVGDPVPLTLA